MGKTTIPYPTDVAIIEGHEVRTDLTCKVTPDHPEIGFDLGFHAGYRVTVPLAELAGKKNELTAVFRVTPEDHPDQQVYFSQKWGVPEIADDASGSAELGGTFELGEGRYQVEWLMRDHNEQRYCTSRWLIAADHPRGRNSQIELRLPPGTVAEDRSEPYASEGAVQRDATHALRVSVLYNVAPQSPRASGMRSMETEAVLSILRRIAREPRIGSYSITAFNLDRNEVVFRRADAPEVDFPALGKAVKEAHLGTVDVRNLVRSDSEAGFLGVLLAEETGRNHPDALIFVGPKTNAEFKVSSAVKAMGAPLCPVFYLNYNAEPTANPWRDAIGSVVKLWKGFEYTITRPRDLFAAWNEVMTRIPVRDTAATEPDQTTISDLLPKK